MLPRGFHPEELPEQVARPAVLLLITVGLAVVLTAAAWLTSESYRFVSDLLLHLAGGAFVAVLLQAFLPAVVGAANSFVGRLVNIELTWSASAMNTIFSSYDAQERAQLFSTVGKGRYPSKRGTIGGEGEPSGPVGSPGESVISYEVTHRGPLLRKQVRITGVEKRPMGSGTQSDGSPDS